MLLRKGKCFVLGEIEGNMYIRGLRQWPEASVTKTLKMAPYSDNQGVVRLREPQLFKKVKVLKELVGSCCNLLLKKNKGLSRTRLLLPSSAIPHSD